MEPVSRKKESKSGIFRIKRAILKADDDIYWENVRHFETAAAELLASEDNALLVIDLTKVSFIASNFIGSLTTFVLKAKRAGKKVKILASIDTSWLFEILGGQDMVEMEVV